MYNFTTYLAKVVAVGNLTEQEQGWWLVRRLPIKYYRYIIERIGAVADELSTFMFERLKQAMLSRITAVEGAK